MHVTPGSRHTLTSHRIADHVGLTASKREVAGGDTSTVVYYYYCIEIVVIMRDSIATLVFINEC